MLIKSSHKQDLQLSAFQRDVYDESALLLKEWHVNQNEQRYQK